MKPEESKLRYILYARKSSEDSERQIQSIDDQVNRLTELAASQHLKVVKVLKEAKSAKRPESRPVFTDALRRIEEGEADGILCWQINRLSRNPVDSGRLQMMLQDDVIKSIQTIDKEYLPTDNVLMFSVESGMANQFIIDLKKNTMRGMQSKLQKGWLPARAPTGYLNDMLAKTIIKDPERFPLMRKMWDLMLTGNHKPVHIIDLANDEWGFRTAKTSRIGGKPLARSAAYKIFNNKFYAGIISYSGKEYQGAHPAVVTLEEFERVQEILGNRSRPREQTHSFPFTGIIRCGTCHCMITAEEKFKHIKSTGKTAKYTYYRCTRRKRVIECKEPAITDIVIEQQIKSEIAKFTIDNDFCDYALGIIRRNNDSEIEARKKARSMLETSYTDIQHQLDNLTKMRYRDLIDDATFSRERESLQQELDKAQMKLNQTHDRTEEWINLTEKAFCFAKHAQERFLTGNIQTKREILAALGSNFVLKDGKLNIQHVEWLVPLTQAKETLTMDINALEPKESLMATNQKASSLEETSRWGGQRESNSR